MGRRPRPIRPNWPVTLRAAASGRSREDLIVTCSWPDRSADDEVRRPEPTDLVRR